MDGPVDNLMDNPGKIPLTRGRVARRLPHRPPTAYPPRAILDTTMNLERSINRIQIDASILQGRGCHCQDSDSLLT